MSYKILIFGRLISIVICWYIINRVRKNQLNEKESFFWVIGSIFMVGIAFFPQFITLLSDTLGVQYPPSILFLLTILMILFILYRQFAKISVLNEKVKELVTTVSVLSLEIEELKQSSIKNNEFSYKGVVNKN